MQVTLSGRSLPSEAFSSTCVTDLLWGLSSPLCHDCCTRPENLHGCGSALPHTTRPGFTVSTEGARGGGRGSPMGSGSAAAQCRKAGSLPSALGLLVLSVHRWVSQKQACNMRSCEEPGTCWMWPGSNQVLMLGSSPSCLEAQLYRATVGSLGAAGSRSWDCSLSYRHRAGCAGERT